VPPWRRSLRNLGFAFVNIGAILTIIGLIALNTPTNCPASGCAYNPLLDLAARSFSSGLTLVMAGIVVMWMVQIESRREDRGPA
jgi:uncharacterized protein YjeT (DUF2065 family)